MKKLFFAVAALAFVSFPQFAQAQSQRNPCFYTAENPNQGNGCIPVSVADPLPVTSSGGADTVTQSPVAPATATATKSELIGCQGNVAGGPNVGQQAAVVCDGNNNLLVSPGGSPGFLTSQVSVGITTTATVAARAPRRSVVITNITGTQQIFCTGNAAAALTNGQLIPAAVGASITVATTSAMNCISAVAPQTVSVAETF